MGTFLSTIVETNIRRHRPRGSVAQAWDERLHQALLDENPWWSRKGVPSNLTKRYPRRDFYPLQRRPRDPEILAIYGPRQVGKTTLLFQLIESLIGQGGIEPRRVLYHSF